MRPAAIYHGKYIVELESAAVTPAAECGEICLWALWHSDENVQHEITRVRIFVSRFEPVWQFRSFHVAPVRSALYEKDINYIAAVFVCAHKSWCLCIQIVAFAYTNHVFVCVQILVFVYTNRIRAITTIAE